MQYLRKTSIAISCFIVVGWAGCGGPKEAPPAETPPAVTTPSPAAPPGRAVTIYRDPYGVPHIYADSAADAAYALGYVQAEDRLEDIYINIRTAVGTMAEAFGKQHVQQDYIMRLVKNGEFCQKYWDTAPEHIRELGDNFMRGVQAYLEEHPDKKPEFSTDLYGWHCAAIGRAMILRWPLGTIMDDLGNKDRTPPFSSNEWTVASSRSAEGCPILLTDPHLTWEGMANFYEARAHGGELEMNGFFLVGSPVLALGHNAHVGWACTTGGPDTSDVYALKLNPQNPMQYEYDGQWLNAEITTITINVKGEQPERRMAAYTKHGPVVGEPDLKNGVAFAGASPYFDQTDLFEQQFRMATAKNADAFYEAMGMNQFMEQNTMFADTEGNIQYVRAGRVPVRPDGYDWSAPVPGNTSATQWLGIHEIADLVQIKNPPQGYMQNCNISPELMMADSTMTPDKYQKYLYNVSWDYSNPRSKRLLELLGADDSVTKEEAMAIAMDVYDILSKPWQEALRVAATGIGKDQLDNPDIAAAVHHILGWNGQFTQGSVAASIVRFWRAKCQDAIDIVAVADGQPLSEPDQIKMLSLLGETVAEMKAKYGKFEMKWGEIYRVGRGDKLFPVDGADFGGGKDKKNFTETVRDAQAEGNPAADGKYVINSGSMAAMLMFFHADGIESYTCTPWGVSADPNSPHYMDQGEKLYSKRQFKPTWFKKEDLLNHVESEKTLVVP